MPAVLWFQRAALLAGRLVGFAFLAAGVLCTTVWFLGLWRWGWLIGGPLGGVGAAILDELR
jgi:hypothetical protein